GIQFETYYTSADISISALEAWASSSASITKTRLVYSNAGQIRFGIDASGYTTENQYDGFGNVVKTERFETAITSSTALTEQALASYFATHSAGQETKFAYDKRNYLSSTTDAKNYTEKYTYDAFGNRTSLENKKGYVWNYQYDKRGNLLEEITPKVEVVGSSSSQEIIKRFTYDAFGNVLSITEAADTAQARTTNYSYNNRGHQITTTYSDQGKLNAAGTAIENKGAQNTNTTEYNSFGLAVVNTNEIGGKSFKTYNAKHLVEYEVDARGFVTRYQYNSNGQVRHLTRYATALTLTEMIDLGNLGTQINSSDVSSRVNSSQDDRSVTTSYNDRGQQISVKQSTVVGFNSTNKSAYSKAESPETQYEYNALGQVTKQSVRVNQTEWAHTYTYYNDLGQVRATVDELGYITAFNYDEFGNLEKKIEYAAKLLKNWTEADVNKPAVTTADRTTRFEYDELNRQTAIIQESVEIGQYDHKQNLMFNSGHDVTTSTTYDALGQVETSTNGLGQVTRTTYDKLGRVKTVQEAARDVKKAGTYDPFTDSGRVSVSPTTTMGYDYLGNQVETVRSSGNSSADGGDIRTTILFDRHGNKLKTTDALGNQVFYTYDERGQVKSQTQTVEQIFYKQVRVKVGQRIIEVRDGDIRFEDIYEWQTVVDEAQSSQRKIETSYEYDANGQRIETWYLKDDGVNYAKEQVSYNAFGEIQSKGLNGTNYASYIYDKVGNLTTSNADGGVSKTFGYDLRGLQTHELVAANTTNRDKNNNLITTDDSNRSTYIIYDLKGQATRQELPQFTAQNNSVDSSVMSLSTPILLQEFDRWGNVVKSTEKPIDSNLSFSAQQALMSEFVYNKANQLIQESKPVTTYWKDNGTSGTHDSTVLHFYDKAGNRIGERKGLNSDSQQLRRFEYDASGKITASIDAHGYRTEFAYDAHGNRVATKNALGYVNTESYDLNGQLVAKGILRIGSNGVYKSGNSTTNLTDVTVLSYAYDDAGMRIADYKGTETSANLANLMKYNSRNQMIYTRNASGVEKTFEYDDQGRKTKETDGLNKSLIWSFDYFGRMLDYTNLAGRKTIYNYDSMGKMYREDYTNTGTYTEYRSYDYYENGMLKSIADHRTRGTKGTGPLYTDRSDDYYSNIQTDSFAYNVAGQKVWEKTENRLSYADTITVGGNDGDPIFDPRKLEPETGLQSLSGPVFNGSTQQKVVSNRNFTRETFTQYDSLGRMEKVKSPQNSASDVNLHKVENLYDEYGNKRAVKLSYEAASSDTTFNREHWYTYDLENRITISKGELVNGKIEIGSQGISLEYDYVGQRTYATTYKTKYTVPVWEGPDFLGNQYWDTTRRERYVYNDLGHLTSREAQAIIERSGSMTFGDKIQYGDWRTLSNRTVDLWGRVTHETNYKEVWPTTTGLTKNYQFSNLFKTTYDGYTTFVYLKDDRITAQRNYDKDNKIASRVDYVGGFDAAGNLTSYKAYAYHSNGSTHYTTDYTINYRTFDGYVRNTEIASSSLSGFKDGTTTYSYDYKGNLSQVVVQDRDDETKNVTRIFETDRQGMTLQRTEGSKKQSYFYTSGKSVASIGSISGVEFDYNYTPISDKYPSTTPGQYVVNEGDTLQSIAQRVYGDESLWYVVADTNGVSDSSQLVAGQTLTISQEILNHNNADTFKPYNAGEIIGDTSPIPIAPPPPEEKCGALTAIIQVVVTVVVSIYAGPHVGKLAGAAIGAAVGDAAGQTASAIFNNRFDLGAFFNPFEADNIGELINPLDRAFDYDWERTAIAAASSAV
ncbi:MAG: LysM peptidoglycan-binding domain-containing protein, partial [Kangiellaceae bacterium]|nr:LysM peptidoglycan-binding domain-containing protein [Kangiellaceae bacterium]